MEVDLLVDRRVSMGRAKLADRWVNPLLPRTVKMATRAEIRNPVAISYVTPIKIKKVLQEMRNAEDLAQVLKKGRDVRECQKRRLGAKRGRDV